MDIAWYSSFSNFSSFNLAFTFHPLCWLVTTIMTYRLVNGNLKTCNLYTHLYPFINVGYINDFFTQGIPIKAYKFATIAPGIGLSQRLNQQGPVAPHEDPPPTGLNGLTLSLMFKSGQNHLELKTWVTVKTVELQLGRGSKAWYLRGENKLPAPGV